MSTVRRVHLVVGLVALLALVLSGGLPGGIVALGLVQGALAALLALGLVLAYRTHRVVNLAHASMGLLSGVLTGMLVTRWHWSFWPAAVVGIALGAALGLLTERLVIARLASAPRVVVLVATIGVAQIFGALQTALPLAFGGALPTYPVPGPSLDISPVHLGAAHLLTLAVVPVAIVALGWFLYRTRVGLGVLAVASDAERARGLGVPASALSALAWAVAGALAAVAGILTIPVLGYSLDGVPSATVLLLALAPAAVAGMRSLPVAALSALALGIAYQASLWFTDRASAADLMLGLVVLAALGTHRQLKGRTAAAMLASSWDVVARVRTTFAARPTPRTTATRVVGWLALSVAAVVVPNVLGASNALLFGTAAAFALAAAGVAVAWSLGGELSLGHWGLVAVGAAISAHVATWTTPLLGLVAAVVASTVAAVILGLAGRGRDSLGFAVAGLAAGVATPALLAQPGLRPPSLPADLGPGLSTSHGAAAIASLLA
ncbi:MAG TPA: branched-chain amino acid ABC transporter permease, partial [Acidimicrobiia bacterium]|nr:branched-chain amino acid ABC transporter permease [Acidimicrobiia bacterium]